jgi:3-hydroxyacyl-CoA dehydrogenase
MTFTKATVYGGGVIGSGWAINFIMNGIETTVYDVDDEKLADAKEAIENTLDFFMEGGIDVLTKKQRDECAARVKYTHDIKTAVADAVFIQENGPEKLPIKQSIIETIEQYNSTAIIASSTSGQLITDIAAKAKYPQRIIAGHPFNPVHLVPLVELAKGEKTSQEAIDKAYKFYKEIGKEPVVLLKECKGFIANSIQNALHVESQNLVAQGVCSVEDADRAVVFGPGLRWGLIGPFMVLELAGGSGGIRGRFAKYGGGNSDKGLDHETMFKGVDAELANRTEKQGKDHKGLERFRDEGLIKLLKYHDKF